MLQKNNITAYVLANAANHAKIAVAYLVAPIPTPADEYFAAWHAAKAMYCLVMAGISGMEVLQ